MKKRHLGGLGLAVIIVIAVVIICIPWLTIPKEIVPEFVLSYAENQTQDYPTTLGAKRFAELVEERSGGRIRIVVYAEGELGREAEVIEQMQFGGIDFARVSLSQLAEHAPELNVLQMPYLYVDSEHMWRVLDGEIGEAFLQSVGKTQLVGLSWYDAGARNFYSSGKPIYSAEDMVGMKIRVQESELMADIVEALGATALPISYEEVYSNLERGFCDGAENNWPSYEAMDHYEVAQYYTLDEHTRMPEMQVCSAHTWEKLSEEDRKLIMECAAESALYQRELWTQREEQSRQTVLECGVTEIALSKEEKLVFQEKMSGVYVKYCREYMDILNMIIEAGEK